MMNALAREISDFLKARDSDALEARQMAAFQIACHFDLAEALQADPARRAHIVLRLERMIERERQRGIRKHWSYDLNRHIALKQALDRLRQPVGQPCPRLATAGGTRPCKRSPCKRKKRRLVAPLPIQL